MFWVFPTLKNVVLITLLPFLEYFLNAFSIDSVSKLLLEANEGCIPILA